MLSAEQNCYCVEEKTNEIYSFFNQGKAFAEAEKYSECSDAFYALSKVSFMGNPFKNVSPEEKAIYNAFREDLKKKSEKAKINSQKKKQEEEKKTKNVNSMERSVTDYEDYEPGFNMLPGGAMLNPLMIQPQGM